jgi:outer membrane protein assembly factor BamB
MGISGMAIVQTNESAFQGPPAQKPLRVWPGVVAVVLQWLAWLVLPQLVPDAAFYGMVGGVLGGALAIIVWWLFFSRAPWIDRIGALVLMPIAVFATSRIVHESIAGGAMGLLLYVFAIPVLCLALVAWAVVCRRLANGPRRVSMVATILLACGAFALVRTGGMAGNGDPDLHWRWTQTPEERLMAVAANESSAHAALPTSATSAPATVKSSADWPGFRGPGRDSIVRGLAIATDWSQSPPRELWRKPVGPGWSSFAVRGDLFYTQEQRGADEVVACYNVSTGQPLWKHADATRFWESNAGAGPRATPTLQGSRVYTCGATGIVNALDAADGSVIWSHNAASDTGAKVPTWGVSGSPLVVDDLVIVAAAGRLVAYAADTGKQRWLGPAKGAGYSSPHLATIGGVKQVLLLDGDGAIGVAPATGTQLWKYTWDTDGIVQPALTADGDLLIGSGSGMAGIGVRRVALARGSGGWTLEERWASQGLKPYFNDFAIHNGHAFGFDGGFLACIDVADGKRIWKGGRYGYGQLILLAQQDLLLVLSEKGGLALVAAKPDQFKELAKLPAIEGKTWNHPVLAGDILLARNAEEMVAFRLAPAKR